MTRSNFSGTPRLLNEKKGHSWPFFIQVEQWRGVVRFRSWRFVPLSGEELLPYKKAALGIVFLWFAIGGIGHFLTPDFFLKIVPPNLPMRLPAVYISGLFELIGALALLHPKFRRAAGIGLICLTVAVTPANVYMWQHPQLFPQVPEVLLWMRLVLQAALLWLIAWATLTTRPKPQ